ncbi:MAG: hypothetical protein JSR34_08650 [Proteobacteria bacterium]|nr:hypothetical protein [Pseudomonadota bacterium]
MRRAAAIFGMILLSLTANAKAAEGIDAIAVYAGSWKTDTVHVDTPFGKAGHETGTLRNDCWRSGEFYACHQYVDGKSAALLVFAYDPARHTYATYPIAPGATAAPAGQLLVEGNTFTFPWQSTQDGKTTRFRVVNVFTDANHIAFRQEYSTDGVHWNTMATGSDTRVADAH